MTVPGPNQPSPLRHPESTWQKWETRRMPDAVRAAALANAVDLFAGKPWDDVPLRAVPHLLEIAKAFESYLAGEEAHG